MHDGAVSIRTRPQFTTLCERLVRASIALRDRGCLMQAIARRYYVVYTIATYLAAKYGITARRRREAATREAERYHHEDIPDIVRALYTGTRSGKMSHGTHSGVLGAVLTEHQAFVHAADLQRVRTLADYGYTDRLELYNADEANGYLANANHLIADLRTLL